MIIFRKILHLLFSRKVTVAKWQVNLFGFICLSVGFVVGSYYTVSYIGKALAAGESTVSKDTDTHFNQGVLSSTSVSGSGAGAVVQLTGSGYKRSLTIDNSSNANTLTDYQVLLDEGEVAYWKMDETSGSSAADSSGNGHTATATGTSIVDAYSGKGRAVSNSNYLKITSLPSFTDQISYVFWAKRTSAGSSPGVLRMIGHANSSFDLAVDTASIGCPGYMAIYTPQLGWTCTTISMATLDVWKHIGVVFTGSVWKVYLDGSLGWTSSSTTISISGDTFIGTYGDGGAENFPGTMDEFRIFNRALSAAEITTLYTSNQSPKFNTLYTYAQEAGNDIRFKDADDSTNLNYWIENFTSTGQNAKIWVKVPSIAANSSKTIYLYYGDGSAAASSGTSTFPFFDDFNDGTNDTGKFVYFSENGGCTYTESGGYLRMLATGSCANWLASTTRVLSAGKAVDIDMNLISEGNHQIHMSDTQQHISNAGARFLGPSNSIQKVIGGGYSDFATSILLDTGRHLASIANLGSGNIQATYDGISYSASGIRSDIDYYFTIMSATSPTNDLYVYTIKSRNISVPEPTISTVGTGTALLSASGTWASATDSNVIDLVWNDGWGNGTGEGATAFSATVANVGTNNTIQFEMKSAASVLALTSANYVSLGTVNTGTTFTKTKADLDGLGIGAGANRYVQVRATFAQTSGTNPQLDSFTLSYLSDTTAPDTNASSIAMLRAAGGTAVSSNGWTKNSSPYFSWTAGTDTQSGIKGYCLYLGTDSAGNPGTSKGLLGTSPVSTTGSTCQFIVSATSLDTATAGYQGGTWLTNSTLPYYLNVRAIDNLNNFSASSTQFQFRFDNAVPTNTSYTACASGNFSNVVDMNFSWPVSGGSAASDSHADILGWQYQINSSSGSWQGTTASTALGLDYIPATASAYTLVSSRDASTIVSGNNTVYFRSVDNAGNVSSDATVRTCNLSYGGAAPAFGGTDVVTVTPATSTSNSYALSWPAATPSGSNTVTHYYYMINTSPPSTLATLQGNASTYIDNGTNLTVAAAALPNVNKGSNTVYVVAVDNASTPNYSPSNYISGTLTLNSTDPDNIGNLVASDSSIKSSSQWNVTLTWTAPSYQGAGNLTYLVKRSTDNSTFTQVGTSMKIYC